MLERFYWVVDGLLAGCSRPGGTGRSERTLAPEERDALLAQDLAQLRERGIGAVLSLTEAPLAEVETALSGLEYLHLPVPDLHAPSPDQILHALAFIDRQRASGRAVAVHCLMGQGRTGTILAAYLIRGGATAHGAIAQIRTTCDGAISAKEQEAALERFAASRDWFV